MNHEADPGSESDRAIRIAIRHMAAQGYLHGPCIGVERQLGRVWQVEFAHHGLVDRSETTDPPSFLLFVDVEKDLVRTEEDWMHRLKITASAKEVTRPEK